MELAGCNGHPACGVSLAQGTEGDAKDDRYQLLLDEYLDGDRARLTALVEEFPARVTINLARSAVQFMGCKESTIAASVPVSFAEATALAARTQPFVDLALR